MVNIKEKVLFQQIKDKIDKEKYFIDLILKAYGAEKIDNPILHGVKNSKYVYIGPINIHVSRKAVETVVKECQKIQLLE